MLVKQVKTVARRERYRKTKVFERVAKHGEPAIRAACRGELKPYPMDKLGVLELFLEKHGWKNKRPGDFRFGNKLFYETNLFQLCVYRLGSRRAQKIALRPKTVLPVSWFHPDVITLLEKFSPPHSSWYKVGAWGGLFIVYDMADFLVDGNNKVWKWVYPGNDRKKVPFMTEFDF